MAFFTARVVLHDATEADYGDLVRAMERQGFSRFVISDDGARYEMLPGDFDLVDNGGYLTRLDVLERIRTATSRIGFKFSSFITESAGRIWSDLQPYDERRTAKEATKIAELDARDAAATAPTTRRRGAAATAFARAEKVRRAKMKKSKP